MKAQIKQYILDNFMYGAPAEQLADDASLLETGVIDSTGVMELVLFLEEQFGIQLDDNEVVPENLDSVDRVCAFVQRKQGAAAPA